MPWRRVRAWLWSRRAAARRAAARRDAGSGAIVVVLFALVVLALAAFVVDSGMAISQRERAMDIAEQAARYAAQDIDQEALRNGAEVAPINFGNCEQHVREYVESVGLRQTDIDDAYCPDVGQADNRITVVVYLTYEPIFTGILYDEPIRVRGEATAEAQTR